ncbi:hypothetical protein HPO96_20685 [Kribbella sandramycini]|uniref:Uncharacterized protein n=1 Tax=Kribbella sandramycini TaxID=60450 RepID=A0A7Y4L1N5_9ACTN|nr:hypothetical protein [Kribbella sandramycini]MBB6564971.1 hypothetical protein [Kribbella sandramycini]NOL42667.1 hypothetical protein [Kribbella sandramycini]
MPVLYRAAIADLRGAHILPLNQLRTEHPDLYARGLTKYAAHPTYLHPWADIPHILHRGPLPAAWFTH